MMHKTEVDEIVSWLQIYGVKRKPYIVLCPEDKFVTEPRIKHNFVSNWKQYLENCKYNILFIYYENANDIEPGLFIVADEFHGELPKDKWLQRHFNEFEPLAYKAKKLTPFKDNMKVLGMFTNTHIKLLNTVAPKGESVTMEWQLGHTPHLYKNLLIQVIWDTRIITGYQVLDDDSLDLVKQLPIHNDTWNRYWAPAEFEEALQPIKHHINEYFSND